MSRCPTCGALQSTDSRTLPERFISFGTCRAYIGDIDDGTRAVKWTCGKTGIIFGHPPWKQVRGIFQPYHTDCGGKPRVGGPTPEERGPEPSGDPRPAA